MKRLLIICGLVCLCVVPSAFAKAGSSIALDQSNPVYGQQVTFTAVTRESAWNEILDCYQNPWGNNPAYGGEVYEEIHYVVAGDAKPVFTLQNLTSSPAPWLSGAATCRVYLEVVGGNGPRVLASQQFNVSG